MTNSRKPVSLVDHDCLAHLHTVAPADSWIGAALRASRFPRDVHDACDSLRALAVLRQLIDDAEDQAAIVARREGSTWQQIADELGVTRQRAHQRWGNIARFADYGPQNDD